MKINKELAYEAKRNGICSEWFNRLLQTEDKGELLKMYLEGIDFCLSNNYPSNEFIRANFKGYCEKYGVFIDDEINSVNLRYLVALGTTEGQVEYNGFEVGQAFIKNQSKVQIIATGNSFLMVDIFDAAEIKVEAREHAKVCINQYGGRVETITEGNGVVKVIRKHSKTY